MFAFLALMYTFMGMVFMVSTDIDVGKVKVHPIPVGITWPLWLICLVLTAVGLGMGSKID